MTTTIETLLAAAAEDAADVTALLCEGEAVTYAELYARVREGAAAWHAHGLRPGDRVACWAANTVECTVAMLSAVVAGGVLVPLNPRYTPAEVAAILPRVSAPFLVAPVSVAGRPLAADALGIAGDARVIALGPGAPDGAIPWQAFLAAAGPPVAVEPHEFITIQFTSGTTGRPKGAVLRQAPMLETAGTWARVVGLGRGDIYPVTYPLAHIGGFKTGLLSPFQARATSVLIPVVSAESIAEVVRTLPVAVLNAPPAAQRYVIEARRTGQLPGDLAIRVAVLGSAIAPPALVRALKQELGVGDVVIGYGLTEATGVCTMTRPGDPLDLVCETIGRPIDGVRARVWAPPGTTGSPMIGEIEVTGSNVMAGYLDDPAATAEVMHDGWLRTGDLGWIGDDGYVRIAGRARDMVIVGGFNVYPAEIEHVLAEHPSVTEAAVVGVPDDRLGEVTAAFVVTTGGLDRDELLAWCRQRLANFKVPRHLWVMDELPRAAVGKIAKPQLRELALDMLREAS